MYYSKWRDFMFRRWMDVTWICIIIAETASPDEKRLAGEHYTAVRKKHKINERLYIYYLCLRFCSLMQLFIYIYLPFASSTRSRNNKHIYIYIYYPQLPQGSDDSSPGAKKKKTESNRKIYILYACYCYA